MKKTVYFLVVAFAAISLLSACGSHGHSGVRCPAYGKIPVEQTDIPS